MDARIEEVKRLIAADLAASPTLGELAASAACSPFDLCRSFRSATGMTISEYRSSLRMRTSLAMLRNCRKDLAEIALDLGFSSHSHFTARFRTHFGMTPSTWRAVSR